ncbi:MAG: arginase family protein [Luteitalea sp.]|nr:arginase family protein [Luteitalea sp.]
MRCWSCRARFGINRCAPADLLGLLGARHAGRVEPGGPYNPERDPQTGVLNATTIASFSQALADAVTDVIRRGEFPIVLGGDCSILLGGLLALRRRGHYGLLFIDGHADFYQPSANPNGEVASMELALATGRGPDVLSNLEDLRPLVRDDDVVAFGIRDGQQQATYGSQPLPPALLSLELTEIQRLGVDATITEAVAHLTRADGPRSGFWIHVDTDVLDDAVMPAVDYRLPGGLSWESLTRALHVATRSDRAVGLEVTIYNPTLDKQGDGARRLVRALADALV